MARRIGPTEIMNEFRSQIKTLIISALGFVAALSWRGAIQQTISTLLPSSEGLMYQYVSAIMVTLIVVVVTYLITRKPE